MMSTLVLMAYLQAMPVNLSTDPLMNGDVSPLCTFFPLCEET